MSQSALPKGFFRTAIALAIPIALQNLLTSCASLIDTAMIVPLGNNAVAAIGIAGRFTFLLNVIAFGFCSGSATLISQFWGVEDEKGIHHSYGVALSTSMVLSLLFALALRFFPAICVSIFGPEAAVALLSEQYLGILAYAIPFMMFSQVTCAALRATEKVSVPLISSLLSVCVNTTLNYCLIGGNFGFPALGVRGAAIATDIGAITQALVVLLFLLFGDNAVCAPIRTTFGFTKQFVQKFARTAAPVLLNESMWAIGTNIYVMVLARQSTEDYSGYSIYETLQQLFFVFFVGICHASAIMVGKATGRGERDEAYATAKLFLIMTPIAGVVLGATLIAVRDPLLSLFAIETAGARQTASNLLLFYGLWIGIRMIQYTSICGIFRAGGDTRTGCVYDMGALYLIGIPAVCIAGLMLHLPFVWIVVTMFVAEDVPKCILCIRHFLSKKWIMQLTSDHIE